MLTYILITAISFCLFYILIEMRKMHKIGEYHKEAKLQQEKEKAISLKQSL